LIAMGRIPGKVGSIVASFEDRRGGGSSARPASAASPLCSKDILRPVFARWWRACQPASRRESLTEAASEATEASIVPSGRCWGPPSQGASAPCSNVDRVASPCRARASNRTPSCSPEHLVSANEAQHSTPANSGIVLSDLSAQQSTPRKSGTGLLDLLADDHSTPEAKEIVADTTPTPSAAPTNVTPSQAAMGRSAGTPGSLAQAAGEFLLAQGDRVNGLSRRAGVWVARSSEKQGNCGGGLGARLADAAGIALASPVDGHFSLNTPGASADGLVRSMTPLEHEYEAIGVLAAAHMLYDIGAGPGAGEGGHSVDLLEEQQLDATLDSSRACMLLRNSEAESFSLAPAEELALHPTRDTEEEHAPHAESQRQQEQRPGCRSSEAAPEVSPEEHSSPGTRSERWPQGPEEVHNRVHSGSPQESLGAPGSGTSSCPTRVPEEGAEAYLLPRCLNATLDSATDSDSMNLTRRENPRAAQPGSVCTENRLSSSLEQRLEQRLDCLEVLLTKAVARPHGREEELQRLDKAHARLADRISEIWQRLEERAAGTTDKNGATASSLSAPPPAAEATSATAEGASTAATKTATTSAAPAVPAMPVAPKASSVPVPPRSANNLSSEGTPRFPQQSMPADPCRVLPRCPRQRSQQPACLGQQRRRSPSPLRSMSPQNPMRVQQSAALGGSAGRLHGTLRRINDSCEVATTHKGTCRTRAAEEQLRDAICDLFTKVRVAQRFAPTLIAMCEDGDAELLDIVEAFSEQFQQATELLEHDQLAGVGESHFASGAVGAAWQTLVNRVLAGECISDRAPGTMVRELRDMAVLATGDLEQARARFQREVHRLQCVEDVRSHCLGGGSSSSKAAPTVLAMQFPWRQQQPMQVKQTRIVRPRSPVVVQPVVTAVTRSCSAARPASRCTTPQPPWRPAAAAGQRTPSAQRLLQSARSFARVPQRTSNCTGLTRVCQPPPTSLSSSAQRLPTAHNGTIEPCAVRRVAQPAALATAAAARSAAAPPRCTNLSSCGLQGWRMTTRSLSPQRLA